MTKKCQSKGGKKTAGAKPCARSYRLKSAKTGNGLSHYVMYGDIDEKKALL